MGYPPPRPPVNPFPFPPNDGPLMYRGKRIDQPLDVTASETLERWCAQPEWDTRSLEEFAAEGGRPVFPPNRTVREPGFLEWLVRPEGGWLAFFRWLFRLPTRDDRGRFYELPAGLELRPRAPAPPPPSTGYLRSSFSLNELRAIEGDMRRQLEELRAGVPPLPRGGTAQSSTIVGGRR